MKDDRGPWYLLTGLVIGIALGLVYAWTMRPVEYINITPASLMPEFKDHQRTLIAAAFQANGNLVRAKARLDLLQDSDTYQTLAEQAQRSLAENNSPEEARLLGSLAVAIHEQTQPEPQVHISGPTPVFSNDPEEIITVTTPITVTPSEFLATTLELPTSEPTTAVLTPTATSSAALTVTQILTPTATATPARRTPTPTPTATPRPRPTDTPAPTLTPTRTPGAPFVVQEREQICERRFDKPMLQIEVLDASEQPVPGVEVIVTWDGGEEHFFTGLKPELGLGYADFTLTPDVSYTVRLADAGQPISGLKPLTCTTSGGGWFWGAWHFVFVQP